MRARSGLIAEYFDRGMAKIKAESMLEGRVVALNGHKCSEQAERAYRRTVAAEEALRVERAKRPDREQIARILFGFYRRAYDYPWEQVSPNARERFLEQADAVLSSLALEPVAHEEPSAEELLDTRAGLALANAAWGEGAAHWKRAQEVQDAGEGWHKPVSPYSAPLLARIKAEREQARG